MSELKLNVGCGGDKKPKEEGWINIDVRKEANPDIIVDIEKCSLPFKDETFDYILAKDVVEHVSWRKTQELLKEFAGVLKKGGKIYIQVPDFEAIVKMWLNQEEKFKKFMGDVLDSIKLSFWIFGNQDYPENTHKACFIAKDLKVMLERAGFEVEYIKNDGSTNLMCEAVKK